ncbi:MAG TPA: hypothetical protein VNZ27_05770 [Rhodanobacter sp.]|jgi:hypothetical protein|nr:hypothetical protein [Rhodanobacter sp.]
MHTSQLIFKIIGVIHGLVGAVLLVMALDNDFQKFCFYRGKDAFQGGLHRNLALFGSSLLIVCGALTFFKPTFAVIAAWLSFLIYLLPSLADLMAGCRFDKFCRECAASFSIRAFTAAALTAALQRGQYG